MEEKIFCSNCKEAMDKLTNFCPKCGTKVDLEEADLIQETDKVQEADKDQEIQSLVVIEEEKEVEPPIKSSKKPIYVSVAMGIIFLIVAISVISGKSNSKGGSNIIYAKDKELHYTYLSKIEPFEITDRLNQNASYLDFDEYDSLSDYILMSDNERYIFYPDRIDDHGVTYYWRDLKADNSSQDAAVKIDGSINDIPFLTGDGSKLIYVRDDDRRLYIFDRESGDKNKLDDEVSNFYVNEKANYMIYSKYSDDEHAIYEMTIDGLSGEKHKIDSDVYLHGALPEEKKVYYTKDESLYLKEFDKSKIKIASDVEEVISIINRESVYYLKTEEMTHKLSTFIKDDVLESDQELKEPVMGEVGPEPEYPSQIDHKHRVWEEAIWSNEYNPETDEYGYWYDQIDYESYEQAQDQYREAYYQWEARYDEIVEKYEEEYNIYLGKENRDELRLALEDEENAVTYDQYLLYYWSEGKENLVASDLAESEPYQNYLTASFQEPVVIYQKYSTSLGETKKLSEIMNEWEGYYDQLDMIHHISNTVAGTRKISDDVYVAVEDKENTIDASQSSHWSINQNGVIYFLDNYHQDNYYGTLMSASLGNGIVEKPVKVDEDVMSFFYGNGNGNCYYFKDMKNDSGDLYLNKKRLATDVYTYSLYNYRGTDNLLYYVDYREKYRNGSLRILKGEVETKVADDVFFFLPVDEKNLVYLKDYNLERQKGDLMLYDGGHEPTLVDYDVTSVLWSGNMLP